MSSFRIVFLAALLLLASSTLTAQEWGYGVKAGLNLKSLTGGEGNSFNTGFHVGLMLRAEFTDLIGVQGELLYSQKGTKYESLSAAALDFDTNAGNTVSTTGSLSTILNVTNSYIDLPILFYYRPTDRIQLGAGVNVGVLVNSVGSGEIVYSDAFTANSSPIDPLIITLDYDYYVDDIGEGDMENLLNFNLDGAAARVPRTIGAYYFDEERDGSFFNTLDFGLNADVLFFLTSGIILEGRVNYGLTDTTNNNYGNSPIVPELTDDSADQNISFQLSIGFNF